MPTYFWAHPILSIYMFVWPYFNGARRGICTLVHIYLVALGMCAIYSFANPHQPQGLYLCIYSHIFTCTGCTHVLVYACWNTYYPIAKHASIYIIVLTFYGRLYVILTCFPVDVLARFRACFAFAQLCPHFLYAYFFATKECCSNFATLRTVC